MDLAIPIAALLALVYVAGVMGATAALSEVEESPDDSLSHSEIRWLWPIVLLHAALFWALHGDTAEVDAEEAAWPTHYASTPHDPSACADAGAARINKRLDEALDEH